MNEQIRSQFPALEDLTYLNSAAVSLLPTSAIDAVTSQLHDVAAYGSEHYQAWVDTKERCRVLLADMIGARSEQVAFLRNTSDGFSAIATGLTWRHRDNIVTFAGEFPSNYYPWRRIRDAHGVEIRAVAERNARIEIDELISLIDARTRVVAISSIQFASGFRSDLERIGRAARAVDALFCVDLIQGLGAETYDVGSQFIDAACGASHKWLCAPEGCGYIYLSQRAMERFDPMLVGWISVEDPWDFTDREQAFKPNALALESGTGPSSLFYGLEKSLELIGSAGPEKIKVHLAQLSDYLVERLAGTDLDVISSRRDGESSAIVCAVHRDGLSVNRIARALSQRNVVVSPRDGRLRIAPHFFNSIGDIDRFIDEYRSITREELA